MKAIDDGGSAFPTEQFPQFGNDPRLVGGMSLRDYFAAQALSGIIQMAATYAIESANRGIVQAGLINPTGWAESAYQTADAMLAKRNK